MSSRWGDTYASVWLCSAACRSSSEKCDRLNRDTIKPCFLRCMEILFGEAETAFIHLDMTYIGLMCDLGPETVGRMR